MGNKTSVEGGTTLQLTQTLARLKKLNAGLGKTCAPEEFTPSVLLDSHFSGGQHDYPVDSQALYFQDLAAKLQDCLDALQKDKESLQGQKLALEQQLNNERILFQQQLLLQRDTQQQPERQGAGDREDNGDFALTPVRSAVDADSDSDISSAFPVALTPVQPVRDSSKPGMRGQQVRAPLSKQGSPSSSSVALTFNLANMVSSAASLSVAALERQLKEEQAAIKNDREDLEAQKQAFADQLKLQRRAAQL